jgi:3-hydroxymyristoyl/3-hydroxydecanoyl-(acyl carrier protein) dehydratase
MHYKFVDRILEIDAHGGGTITACKTFPRTEDYFDGTFRRQGEVPASLVLETIASASSFLLIVQSRYHTMGLLLKLARASFLRPVLAGDRLIIQSRIVAIQRDRTDPRVAPQDLGIAEIHTRGTVEDVLVAEAEALYLCVPMVWVFGARKEEIVTRALELLGCADARP